MRLRLVAVVSVAAVALILVVVLVSTGGGGGTLAVSVVLTQPEIHSGTKDRATVINDSADWLTYGGCVNFVPRVGPVFEPPSNSLQCDAYMVIAPHSRFQIQGLLTSFRASTPGKYWLVFPYLAGKGHPPHRSTMHWAYAKLTVTS